MRILFWAILPLGLLSLGLTACKPIAEEPTAPLPEKPVAKTIGPVVTIHCTLKHFNTGHVSTGTYFTYDTRTKHIPSDKMLGKPPRPELFNRDLEHFKEVYAASRLDDGWVEVPVGGPNNKFKLDTKHIWFWGGHTRQYGLYMGLSPMLIMSSYGRMFFGGKVTDKEGFVSYQGHFELSGAGRGGAWGTWHFNTGDEFEPLVDDWGYLTCAYDQPPESAVREPSGLRAGLLSAQETKGD